MARTCLFCDGKANTKEHLWPEWILNLVNPLGSFYGFIGTKKRLVIKRLGLETKCVCNECNGGWMSDLETSTKPIMGPLIQDVPKQITAQQERMIAIWAIKTAMVFESITTSERAWFYTETERHLLRSEFEIPSRTRIWIARYEHGSISAYGTDSWYPAVPPRVEYYFHTTVIGHLAIQNITFHIPAEYSDRPVRIFPKAGAWEQLLIPIWPAPVDIDWPPLLSFSGTEPLTDSELHGRWKTGNMVS